MMAPMPLTLMDFRESITKRLANKEEGFPESLLGMGLDLTAFFC
jgi:hypothetical protein